MKLIAYLMIFFSVSSFATILEENATNDEIRDAIIISLQSNDLNCKGTSTVKASSLRIADIFKNDYTLMISEDLSQPLITMQKLGANNNPKNKNVLIVTTDKDFKVVTQLVAKTYHNVRMSRVNIGTIIEPKYREELIDGKPSEDLVCN